MHCCIQVRGIRQYIDRFKCLGGIGRGILNTGPCTRLPIEADPLDCG